MKKTRKEKRKLKTKEYHWEKMVSECMALNKKLGVPATLIDVLSEMQDMAFDKEEPWPLRISLASLLLHFESGQQTFDLSDKIYQMFLRTDLKNVYAKDIRLPYKCIYVVFPKKYRINIKNESGIFSEHICEGIFLFAQEKDGHDHIYVSIPAYPVNSPILADSNHRFGMGLSSCISITKYVENPDKPFDLNEIILIYLSKFATLNKEDKSLDLIVEMISVAFNTIIYLNHGLKTKTVQKQNINQLEKLRNFQKKTKSNTEKIKVDRIITRLSIANVTSLEPHLKGLKLNEMTATDILVRGHWHTYWIGEGRTKRKVNWVQPHIRNKTETKLDEIQARQYSI